jgi:predicted CopG family antitoxin
MATVSITVTEEAYRRLKKLKQPGDSFSDVIVRELPEPCDTGAELLESFKTRPVPKADPQVRKIVLANRGRRSSR